MAGLLIVDDDRDLCEILAEFLADRGHRIRTAPDGEEGLRVLPEVKPDAILLDVDMPNLDGPSMALRLIAHDAGLEEIPILLLSGCSDVAEVAHQIGTPYYLTKPVAPDRILDALSRMLTERTAPRPQPPDGE